MGQAAGPEGVVAVTEVGEGCAVKSVYREAEETIPELAQCGDVGAAPARDEARALGEVRAGLERLDEAWDLRRVGRAVGVEHHDQVSGHRREAGPQRVALALAGLGHHLDARVGAARGGDGFVLRVPVDEDHLVEPLGQFAEDGSDVLLLVHRGDHHRDLGLAIAAPAVRLGVAAGASTRSSGRGSRLTGTPTAWKARTRARSPWSDSRWLAITARSGL